MFRISYIIKKIFLTIHIFTFKIIINGCKRTFPCSFKGEGNIITTCNTRKCFLLYQTPKLSSSFKLKVHKFNNSDMKLEKNRYTLNVQIENSHN